MLLGILVVAALLYAFLNLNIRYTLMALGLPLALLIVTHPRLALYQFVFVLFIEYTVLPSGPVMLVDVSAALVLTAALLDVLCSERLPARLPPLTWNYVALIAALAVTGIFAYRPELAIRPTLRVALFFATFLAVYRLSSRVSVGRILKIFFALAVLHSAYSMGPFLASGGVYRSFGFTRVIFDDLAMVSLPIGVSLYLWSQRRTWFYLIGCLIVLGALVATQSRGPILFSLVACLFVLFLSYGRAVNGNTATDTKRIVTRRIRWIIGGSLLVSIVAIVFMSALLATVTERFERLMSFQPSGSVIYRLALWKRALAAFWDNPVMGVGPGGYKHLSEIYPTLHLSSVFYFTRHFSAHNLFFHYLAETGVVGASALAALFINQYRVAQRNWRNNKLSSPGIGLALLSWAFLFALTTLIEAGWMWGQLGYVAIFLTALLAREDDTRLVRKTS